MLQYTKTFDPELLRAQAPKRKTAQTPPPVDYEYTDELVLAINVALVTGRPLLLRGDPGSGKSTLAADVARLLHRRYYEQVVSSNTEATDLLWRMDHIARVADAQAGSSNARERPGDYIEPGVLWWAFDPEKARLRGMEKPALPATDLDVRTWELKDAASSSSVVLIDEIDKAEPDFPNDLLVPLGALAFHVRTSSVNVRVHAYPELRPLVIVTTNEERDLPPAFLRRCIVVRLAVPTNDDAGRDRLRAIARRHFSDGSSPLEGDLG